MYGKIKRIHFIGIGGIGMSGIAEVLLNMGYEISGSDLKKSPIVERLEKLGAQIWIGHSGENIKGSDVVVYSSAVKEDNPEVISANAANIPLIPRAEMLSELMRLKFGIAVLGSHGKTTTTSMIASVLTHGGLDPTIVVGGRVKTLGTNAHLGSGKFMVAEADESDGSFNKLSPVIAVLTNIDEEHLDHYKNIKSLEKAFLEFFIKIPFYGLSVLCTDCPRTKKISKILKKKVLTYGINSDSDLKAKDIVVTGFKTVFNVLYKDFLLGEIELNIPGKHNAQNALASIAVGMELGLSFEKIKKGLMEFKGIERRLQIKGNKNGIMIIDDYGHHPKEIETTIESLRLGFSKEPIVIFQPHRFTRTKLLYDDFVRVLKKIDKLYILDIYAAGENPLNGINSKKLSEDIKKAGNNNVFYVNDPEKLVGKVKKELKKGDIVLTTGAGNVWIYGEKLAGEI
ncbi:MAG: UDP-N-acetylmuramate--L-alanine ligase [Thermodesulfobacteriota bacterium]